MPVQIGYIVVYLVFAFFAARWNRGVLPVAAVLAVLLAIFALVAGPALVRAQQVGLRPARAQRGPARPAHAADRARADPAGAFAMRGFKQGWNVELERRDPRPVRRATRHQPLYPA